MDAALGVEVSGQQRANTVLIGSLAGTATAAAGHRRPATAKILVEASLVSGCLGKEHPCWDGRSAGIGQPAQCTCLRLWAPGVTEDSLPGSCARVHGGG